MKGFLQRTGLLHHFIDGNTLFPGCLHHDGFVHLAVVNAFLQPLFPTGSHALVQHAVPCLGRCLDQGAQLVAYIGEQCLRLVEVTDQKLPCLGPAGAQRFLQRVYQHAEGLDVLRSGIGLFANVRGFVGILGQRAGQYVRGHPLVRQRIIEVARCIKSLIGLSCRISRYSGVLVAVLHDGAQLNGRVQQLLLEFLGGHVGIFNAFPVDQLDVPGRQSLTEIIHCPASFFSRSTGNCSHVTNTLDGQHSLVQLDACIGEFANVIRHVGEGIDRLVRVFVQLLQIPVHRFQAFASACHNGLH